MQLFCFVNLLTSLGAVNCCAASWSGCLASGQAPLATALDAMSQAFVRPSSCRWERRRNGGRKYLGTGCCARPRGCDGRTSKRPRDIASSAVSSWRRLSDANTDTRSSSRRSSSRSESSAATPSDVSRLTKQNSCTTHRRVAGSPINAAGFHPWYVQISDTAVSQSVAIAAYRWPRRNAIRTDTGIRRKSSGAADCTKTISETPDRRRNGGPKHRS